MSRRGQLCGALLFALASCADARDLFRPHVPNPEEEERVLATPMPAPVVDVAFVLGCPADPDGSASLCERCRVKSAVRAYREGVARNFIFSGGAAHSPHVEADVMGDLAEKRGIPHEHVFREGRALTTWQNIRFSLAIARAQKFHSILFISTADHLPRVQRIARFYGIADTQTGFRACDRDLPPDFAEEPQKAERPEAVGFQD